MLAALAASVFPLVLAGRCFPQLLQSIDDSTISLYNATSGKVIPGVPEGIKPQPAMPGNGPFFTAVLETGQLCYTGAAQGLLKPIEDCSCSSAFKAYEAALFKVEQNPSQFDDAQIQAIADAGESLAATGCVDLETQAVPPYIYPNYTVYRDRGKMSTPTVAGRICIKPEVRVTNEARSAKLMTPWEFSDIRSSSAACNCPRDTEYISQNFGEDDAQVASYVNHLENIELIALEEGVPDLKRSTATSNLLGTCNVNRNGYAWSGSDITGLPMSGSGNATVTVNATETEIPVFPGSNIKASCGGVMDPNERINFCLYKLESTTTALPITPSAVTELSNYCNNPLTPANIGDNRFTKCCMNVTVQHGGNDYAKVIVRRDLMVTLQCRASQFATNSGTGRFHSVPQSPFDDTSTRITAAIRAAGGVETNFMPDLSPDSLNLRRNQYVDSGFSDVCVPKRRQLSGAQCTKFAPYDITKDQNAKNAGIFVDTDKGCNLGFEDDAQSNEWAQTDTGMLLSLRRAASPWNACVMPSTYASSGNPNKLSPCDIIKHFNMMPQVFTNQSKGWTRADFAQCTMRDVPAIAAAWYNAIMGVPSTDQQPGNAPEILEFWASMPPSFYIGAASFPAAIADYFTTKENQCFPNVPGRGVGESTGVQGPSAGGATPPDIDAVCSTQGCCPGMKPPPGYNGSLTDVCCTSANDCTCFTGTNPAEIVFSRMDNSMVQKLVEDCLNADYNVFKAGDNPTSNRFCVHAGQYVTDKNKIWKRAAPFTPMFEGSGTPTVCQDLSSNRIRIVGEGTADASIVFVATAPRLRGKPLHPFFQTANYVGGALADGNFNFTDTPWVDSQAYSGTRDCSLAGASCRPIFFSTGERATFLDVPTTVPKELLSNTTAYDGIELALVASPDSCFVKNHRGSVNFNTGDTIIPIPGLYPRWIDIQQGGTPLLPNTGGPCITYGDGNDALYLSNKNNGAISISNWKTHGDRFGVDIYNWGGGIPPFSKAQGNPPGALAGESGFMPAHTVGFFDSTPYSQTPRPMLPTLGTCLIEDPARCNTKCNLGDFEASIGEITGEALGSLFLAVAAPAAIGALGGEAAAGTAAAVDGGEAIADGGDAIADGEGQAIELNNMGDASQPSGSSGSSGSTAETNVDNAGSSSGSDGGGDGGGDGEGDSGGDGGGSGGSSFFQKAGSAFRSGASAVGSAAKSGARVVGSALKKGARFLLHNARTTAALGLAADSVRRSVELAEVSRIGKGKSIYDVDTESSSSGSPVAVVLGNAWKDLFQARLDVVNDGDDFVFLTGRADKAALELYSLYQFHPSGLRACLYEYGPDDQTHCVGPADDLSNPTQAKWNEVTENAESRLSGLSRNAQSAQTERELMEKNTGDFQSCSGKQNINIGANGGSDMSWWAGRTSMLESTSIGSQIACHTAYNGGSGMFKLRGNFAKTNKFKFILHNYRDERESDILPGQKPSIEFNSVESDTIAAMLGNNLYTAVDGAGDSIDIMSDFGPSQLCGLCSNIGAASDTSPIRKECTMESENGNPLFTRYDIADSLGVYDSHANTFFGDVKLYDSETNIDSVRFTYFDVIGDTSDYATQANFSGSTNIERLLGVDLRHNTGIRTGKRAASKPACIGDLHAANVPYCEIEMDLQHKATEDAPACRGLSSAFGTTCPNPRVRRCRAKDFFSPALPFPAHPHAAARAVVQRRAPHFSAGSSPWSEPGPRFVRL